MSYNSNQSSGISDFLNKNPDSIQQSSGQSIGHDESKHNSPIVASDEKKSSNIMETVAYYFFLGTVILAPLVFWANPYIPQELIKTFVIGLGTIISTILFGFVFIKERRIVLPPKTIFWTSILIVLSASISALNSIQIGKSFLGQGFEIETVAFIATLFLAGLLSYTIIVRRPDRSVVVYVGMVVSFLILYIFQSLRLVFHDFMSLSIFSSITGSLIGSWYNLGLFAVVVMTISLLAINMLSLSRIMKIAYWILSILAFVAIVVVDNSQIWIMTALTFAILTVYCSLNKSHLFGGVAVSFFKRIAWMPLVVCILAVVMFYQSPNIVRPVLQKINVGYSEIRLPWQLTLDVTASSIKSYPLLGVGPNHFAEAYLAFKPVSINSSNAWGTEFSSGFGFISTFVATQGIVGTILWILFLVFLGVISVKVLTNLPQEKEKKYIIVSSFASIMFLWFMAIIYVPSHSILYLTFILTGIFIGASVSYGTLSTKTVPCKTNGIMYKIFTPIISLLILIAVIWGLIYIKKTVAFFYFATGVKQLSVSRDAKLADMSFTKALSFDASDIYWRAKVETSLVEIRNLAVTVTANTPASTSETVVKEMVNTLNKGVMYANNAIKIDPTNYYNYLSLARAYEIGISINMSDAYDNAVKAYTEAINRNPYNPSIYLSLANLQANNNKLDDALKTSGVALQVKNNYLDAVFLLSKIYAAKGDLPNAITAAKVATQLNPNNSLLLFQLGILDYNYKDYKGAIEALTQAIKIQSDYANAKYFLGLSEARLSHTNEAIVQFEDLANTNPDNEEIKLILENLKEGKSIFADGVKSPETAPEKRPKLPIKENK